MLTALTEDQMDIRILSRGTHYENPCCKCDHDPVFPEHGEPAAPEELRARLKAGISDRDWLPPESENWFRRLRSAACDLAYGKDFSLRAPLVGADGQRLVVLSWRCDEQGCSGHTNEVSYELIHALVDLPDDIFAALCHAAREQNLQSACRVALERAFEEQGLTPKAIEARRAELLRSKGLDAEDTKQWRRVQALEDELLLDWQVDMTRKRVEGEVTARVRAEAAS